MQWTDILAGALLLLFGRRLFWLFVGCVGFIVGFDFASNLFQGQPQWLLLAIASGVGLLGAIASVFLQRLVVGIAGFFAGGYFLANLAPTLLTASAHPQAVQWIAYVVGGILGAILTMALLEPALIALSSLAGATAISQSVSLNESNRGILFLALLIFGIIVQSIPHRSKKKPSKKQPSE